MTSTTPPDSFAQLLADLNTPSEVGWIGRGKRPPGAEDLSRSKWWTDISKLRAARLAREAAERESNIQVGLAYGPE